MNSINFQQKIAVLRILLDIINADGRIDERETFYFEKIAKILDVTQESIKEVTEANSLLSLLELKGLSEEHKIKMATLMGEQIVVDQDININEVAIFGFVCSTCGIDIDLKDVIPQDVYDGCSFS